VCKVADLGLARHKRRTFLSGAVGLRGTLPWMAPEVVKTPGAVDERADVFAFGVVMWELWTCKVHASPHSPYR
jgi:serine/threonine protein kinase